MTEQTKKLGDRLADLRRAKGMSLRKIEQATEGDVSNAYLSQLETGKIKQPSPNILYSLSQVYGVSYESLMELAGYITPVGARSDSEKHGRVPTLAKLNLTKEEEDEILKYLGYLRSRRGKREQTK